jgi:hypothetical protein
MPDAGDRAMRREDQPERAEGGDASYGTRSRTRPDERDEIW